jgi:hypothetical protein
MLNALIASLERRLPMADFYLKSGDLADAPKPKTENPKPAATRQEAGGPEQEFEGP